MCGAYTVYDILEIIIGDGWNNEFNEQNLDLLQYYNLILCLMINIPLRGLAALALCGC